MRLRVIMLNFLIFSSLFLKLLAQPNFEAVKENLVEIKSIDIYDESYLGYESFKQEIGNKTIVMLGEQTHGHGTTFTAKTKIIKYLVENMNFDVIAFESSFYEINKIWESDIEFSKKVDSVKSEIYGIWSKTNETLAFFEYIKQKGASIDLTGFDCQHEMPYGKANYVRDFNNFLKQKKLPITDNIEYSKFENTLRKLIKFDLKTKPSAKELGIFNKILDLVKSQLENSTLDAETSFWIQEISSLKKETRSAWNPTNLKGVSRFAARDSAMAENLLWLVNNKYKGRKIIVWAASYHIAKNKEKMERTKWLDVEKLQTMGNIVDKNLPGKVYGLGFICSEGRYSEWYAKDSPTYPINPSPSSMESLLAKAPYNYAFLNMKQLKNEKYFKMAGTDHFETSAVWNKIFDGVFYIRKMNPPTYLSK